MISLDINTLQIGKTLARDLYDDEGRLLLPKGVVLSSSYVANIMRMHNGKIFVHDDRNTGETEAPRPEALKRQSPEDVKLSRAFVSTVGCVKAMMDGIINGHIIRRTEVDDALDLIFPEVIRSNNVLRCLQGLKRKDDYTFEHSVSVCVIAVKLGQMMNITDEKLRYLGMAALLHDMGKAKVPPRILNKPDRLTNDEYEEIKKHPVYGFRIVRDIELVDRTVELAVLQHHERMDGSGYPLHLNADKIHLFSSIVAVADVFDAITSERLYRPRFELLAAMEEMSRKQSGYLNPLVSQRLVQYIMSIVPGEEVVLNNGEVASIVMVYDNEPLRPLIKLGSEFVDLREARHFSIENRV